MLPWLALIRLWCWVTGQVVTGPADAMAWLAVRLVHLVRVVRLVLVWDPRRSFLWRRGLWRLRLMRAELAG